MPIKTARHDDDALEESHEINVTPFIDVMLVLLIIFMVAAPLATVDTPVDLPASTAQPQPRDGEPVFLSVQADLSLSINDVPVGRDGLKATLERLTAGDHEQRIYLRADQAVPYGDLMQTMNALRTAGYRRIALVGLEQRRE
ncbi:biopolymer transporter [Stenotrophomonas sp. HMSC10F06]|nr:MULTISPECIES: TonB system transport protein ExbD [Stenotrophomonas]MDX5514262.1 TonB system transport protein ExbD [Stenotrophomonas sp. RG-453]OFS91233.1 biopolymer transporter [Stenotrophomonas sp. HMSC10F06]